MFRVSRPILGRFLTPIRVVPIVPIRFSSDKIDTKKLILKLRQESGLPLGQCRNALMATNWDMEAAKIHIQEEAKKLGLKKMESLGKFIQINYFISFNLIFSREKYSLMI